MQSWVENQLSRSVEEVKNVKKKIREDGRMDGHQTKSDQISSLEFSAQVS